MPYSPGRAPACDDDLNRCFAYSDSVSDLPLLETVGNPVVVNPDRELREHAAAHQWPVIEVEPPAIAARLRRLLPRVA